MTWDLTGHRVSSTYRGNNHINGTVIHSRRARDGQVWHTILLDTPRVFSGRKRVKVIVPREDLTSISPKLDQGQ